MRPSWWITPTICAPGHHMSVAGAPVPSTLPSPGQHVGLHGDVRADDRHGRLSVETDPDRRSCSRSAATSRERILDHAARGGSNVAISVAAAEDMARCTIARWSALMAMPAGRRSEDVVPVGRRA